MHASEGMFPSDFFALQSDRRERKFTGSNKQVCRRNGIETVTVHIHDWLKTLVKFVQ